MTVRRLFSRPARCLSVGVSAGLVAIGLTACQPQPHAALVVGDGSHVNISQPDESSRRAKTFPRWRVSYPQWGSYIAAVPPQGGKRPWLGIRRRTGRRVQQWTPAVAAPGGLGRAGRDKDTIGCSRVEWGKVLPRPSTCLMVPLFDGTLGRLPSWAPPGFTPLHVDGGRLGQPFTTGQFEHVDEHDDRGPTQFAARTPGPIPGAGLFHEPRTPPACTSWTCSG